MSKIQESSHRVSIRTFEGYCDGCSARYKPAMLNLAELTIVRTKPSDRFMGSMDGEPYATVPPITKESTEKEIVDAGWKHETLHGKELLFCPSCSVK